MYRALIEGSAFGARAIIERFEEYGVSVQEVITCGGIAEKSPLVMQIYADVTGRPMKISRSGQTCALGAAIMGAVVAGRAAGGYDTVEEAQHRMCGVIPRVHTPSRRANYTYNALYKLYRQLHDAFGTLHYSTSLHNVMKELLTIRDAARGLMKG